MKLLKNICILLILCYSSFNILAQNKENISKIVVISGHPNLNQSSANKAILSDLEKHFGNQISIHRLDTLYPDYQIDIKTEQQAILAADLVVFQFPLYWYSTPALLKKWIDDVLTDFFPNSRLSGKFRGKKVIASITAGGSQKRYSAPDPTIEQYLLPLQKTFETIGGKWISPVASYSSMPSRKLSETAANHSKQLIKLIEENK